MKPVYSAEFQKRRALREGKNDKIDNFEIDILDEGVLDKAMGGPGKTLDRGKPEGNFMRSLVINTSNK